MKTRENVPGPIGIVHTYAGSASFSFFFLVLFRQVTGIFLEDKEKEKEERERHGRERRWLRQSRGEKNPGGATARRSRVAATA